MSLIHGIPLSDRYSRAAQIEDHADADARPAIGGPPPLRGTEEHGWEGKPPEEDPRWDEHAGCKGQGPDLWFPKRGESTLKAKAICALCPVRPACLVYALEKGEKFGIWGGKSERERREMRRTYALAERTCICGTAFAPSTRKQMFCTKGCAHAQRQRVMRGAGNGGAAAA